ncbi:MAG: cell wall hydrolase, partial [Eubacterium sp.]|nr:cell wall hydrolase [Eubacterium sp.]
MKLKKLVVLMMAVITMATGVLAIVTPSEAAEPKKTYTNKEVKMLSTIIFCEAGNQSYAGKLAVGIVVMNRKRSSKFPNSVEGVIKQPYQFS